MKLLDIEGVKLLIIITVSLLLSLNIYLFFVNRELKKLNSTLDILRDNELE
jgi:hypothetical protein